MFIHKLPVTDYFQLGLVLICLAAGSRSDFTKTKTKRFLAGAYVLIAIPDMDAAKVIREALAGEGDE